MSEFGSEEQTLGGRLQESRERQGLTISETARLTGVRTKTLRDWELDRSEPRANRLVNLAGILGVNASYLLDGLGGQTVPAQKTKPEIKALIADLLEQTEAISQETAKISEKMQSVTTQLSILRQAEW